MTLLKAEDITVADGATRLLHPVSLHLDRGEPLVILGETGSGKSLLAQALMGTLPEELSARGRVAIGDRLLDAARPAGFRPLWGREIAVLPQEPWLSLDPLMRAERQVREAHRLVRGLSAAEARDRTAEDFRRLDLTGAGQRFPHELSGGMAQRVAIGRALLSDPVMLLMDEPLAALDGARKAEILPYLERLRREAGVPILYVSHNMAEVARLATHVVAMEGGRVTQAGPAEAMLADPGLVRVMGLRDAGAVLQARVLRHAEDGVSDLQVSGGVLCLPLVDAPVGTDLRVRILAQDVMLATERPRNISALNILPVTVLALRRGDGPGVIVQVQAGDDLLLARITRRSADALGLRPGGTCFAVLKSVAVAPTDIGLGLQS